MEILGRENKRKEFLTQTARLENFKIEPLAIDASSRRYFRVFSNNKTFILMDDEGCKWKPFEFAELSVFFRKHNILVPEVFFADLENGLLLLEDFGDGTLTNLLSTNDEKHLYRLATEALIKVIAIEERPLICTEFPKQRLIDDICFFIDWYFPMAAGYPLPIEKRQEFVELISGKTNMAYKVPNRIMLWDYHVDNIILLPDSQKTGILDFQDAMWGPLTYDIMSLLEDARREVSPAVQTEMKELFFNSLSNIKREDFEESYAFMSMFRHMRVMGRFTILMAVNKKDKYIKFIPHLWNMLNKTLKHPGLKEIKDWLDTNFPKKLRHFPKRKPINKAILLAAGRGSRMQNLTDDLPKPLIKVGDKTLIDYNFERFKAVGITDFVVNLCYKGDLIREHVLQNHSDVNISFSEEEEALETGGGVKKALPLLKDNVFFVANSDVFSIDTGVKPGLWQMIDLWDSEKYDIILLLNNMDDITGDNDKGIGNYKIENNTPIRNVLKEKGFPYFFSGISLVNKKIFEGISAEKFSLRDQFDTAQKAGRLGFVINQGNFYHIGTPEALQEANIKMRPPHCHPSA